MPRKKKIDVEEVVDEAPQQTELVLTQLATLDYEDTVLPASAFPPNSKIASPEPTPDFVRNIKRRGIINPVLCYREADQTLYIMAGKRRVKAARKLDPEYPVPTRIYARMPTADALTIETADNANRRPNGLSDLHVLMQLNERNQPLAYSMLPKGTIRKTMKIVGLEQPFLQAVIDGKMSMATAGSLARLTPKERAPFLEQLAAGKKVTAQDVAKSHWAKARAAAQSLGSTHPLMPNTYDASSLYLVLGADLKWAQGNVKRPLKSLAEAEGMRGKDGRIFKLVEMA